MARKWTFATASRRVRLQWLKKAQKMRRYYARCRAKLGIPKHRAVPLTTRHTEYTIPRRPAEPAQLTASDLWEGPAETPVHGPANWLKKPNPWATYSRYDLPSQKDYELVGSDLTHERAKKFVSKAERRAPSRFAMYHKMGQKVPRSIYYGAKPPRGAMTPNPGMSSQIKPGARVSFVDHDGKIRTGRAVMPSSSGGWVLNMGGRYGTPAVVDDSNITRVSSRPRAKNPELLVVSNNPQRRKSAMRRRRLTPWMRLVKKYGVKGAKRHYHKGGRHHRRRRRRNSWHGHRAAHRRAARKGWRKRRRGGHRARRRRGGRRRGRGGRRKSSSRPFKGAVKWGGRYWRKKTLRGKIGKRRLSKLLRKRGRRANRRRFRRRN